MWARTKIIMEQKGVFHTNCLDWYISVRPHPQHELHAKRKAHPRKYHLQLYLALRPLRLAFNCGGVFSDATKSFSRARINNVQADCRCHVSGSRLPLTLSTRSRHTILMMHQSFGKRHQKNLPFFVGKLKFVITKVNFGENEFPVVDEKILEALDDKARTYTIYDSERARSSSSSPVAFPPGPEGIDEPYRFEFWKLESELGVYYVGNVPGRHFGHLVMTPIWKHI
ncbi:hypothetical protein V8E53_012905 [Lactarius tabidus]